MTPDLIDGHWIDICSVVSGFAFVVYRRWGIYRRSPLTIYPMASRKTGMVFSNGVAIFPLLVMVASAISSQILMALLESSKITLAVAGVSGTLAILEEEL
jgi:hypothetical protein